MGKVKLGDVLTLQKGKKPKNMTNKLTEGYLPYIDIKAFEKGIIDNYADGEKCLPCENGELLIVCDGSRSGLIGIAKKGYVGSTLAKVSADGIKPAFLAYFLKGKYRQLNTSVKGTGTPHVNQEVLKNFELVVPSLPEQNRIVEKLDELFSELDNGIETLQKTKAQLKVYRQAVLKDAFEGKWHYKNRKHVYIENCVSDENTISKLPLIPSEWKYMHLSQLGDLGRGKSKHRPRNDEVLFEDGKYPFIQTGDVKKAQNHITEWETMYGEFGLKQSKLWPKGTLCITIAANIAETCFLGVDACFPDSVVGFTPYDEKVTKEYVRYFIETSKIRLSAFAPATAQKNINLTTLENLIIPYCELDEQKYIVQEIESRLSICDQIEKTVDDSLRQAENLRQSILKQAFEGRLV